MAQYNKIFFQSGPQGNVPGWKQFVQQANVKGIPVSTAVSDTMSLLDDLQTIGKQHGVANRGNFRPTGYLSAKEMQKIDPNWQKAWGSYHLAVPVYNLYGSYAEAEAAYKRSAKLHLDAVETRIPTNMDRQMVSVSTWNEIRPYGGWGSVATPDSKDWQNKIPGFEGWADSIGWQAYWIGQELIRRKNAGEKWFRWAPFAYAGGNPEVGTWEAPGMLKYLALAGENPDVLGVCLHEYSFTMDIWREFEQRNFIGRFEKLFAVCDKHKIRRPWIEIKEWGWEERDIPTTSQAIKQLGEVAKYYAQYPEIKLAATWTANGGWGSASDKVPGLTTPLYAYTLQTTFPDPQTKPVDPPPDPPPDPTPVPSPTKTLSGVDTSSGTVTEAQLKEHPLDFSFQRAVGWRWIGGKLIPYKDPAFMPNVQTYLVAGVPVGAYMVLYPYDPAGAAQKFAGLLQTMNGLQGKCLRGVVAITLPGLKPTQVRTFLQAFSEALPDYPKLIIQTRTNRWEKLMGTDVNWAKEHPLWIIDFEEQRPAVPQPWTSWNIWQKGTDVWGKTAVALDEMAATALEHLLVDATTQPDPEPAPGEQGEKVDMRPYFFPPNGRSKGDIFLLDNSWSGGQERVQLQRQGDVSYVVKNSQYEKRIVKDGRIHLVLDTSPGNNQYYTVSSTTGWMPQQMAVGDRFTRHEDVEYFRKRDCKKVNSATFISDLIFAAHHASWTSRGQITLNDVVELAWEVTRADGTKYIDERYFFAAGYGLVGWHKYDGHESWINEVATGQQDNVMEHIPCL